VAAGAHAQGEKRWFDTSSVSSPKNVGAELLSESAERRPMRYETRGGVFSLVGQGGYSAPHAPGCGSLRIRPDALFVGRDVRESACARGRRAAPRLLCGPTLGDEVEGGVVVGGGARVGSSSKSKWTVDVAADVGVAAKGVPFIASGVLSAKSVSGATSGMLSALHLQHFLITADQFLCSRISCWPTNLLR